MYESIKYMPYTLYIVSATYLAVFGEVPYEG